MSESLQHPLEAQAVDYVLGLMSAAERVEFVPALEADGTLQRFVAELSESAAAMTLELPQRIAPATAREQVLERANSLVQKRQTTVILPPIWKAMNPSALVGWGMAACFLVYSIARTSSHYTELQKAQEQLAVQEQRTHATLAELKQEVEAKRAASEAASAAIATARQTVEAAKAQLKAVAEQSRYVLMQKDADYAKLVAERDQLFASQKLIHMQIATLQATIDDYKQGVAVVVWNAQNKEGLLKLERMPAIPANKDFQLWVVDPAYNTPVDGGIIKVDEKGFARVEFKPQLDVNNANKFAISVEKKGGVPVAEGPIVLLSN